MNLVEFHSLRYFALRLPPILLEWADCKGICAHSSDLLVQDIGSDWLHVAITFSAFVSLALAWQRRHPFWAQRRRAAIPKLPFSMVLTSIWRTLNNIFCSFNLRSLTVVPASWSTGCMFLSEIWNVHSPSFATKGTIGCTLLFINFPGAEEEVRAWSWNCCVEELAAWWGWPQRSWCCCKPGPFERVGCR